MHDDSQASHCAQPDGAALERLRAIVTQGWPQLPPGCQPALDRLLGDALVSAAGATPEVITVMNPTSRPQRLRLAALVGDAPLDSFYHNEWAELAASADGRLFLVYRRRDGGDYAVAWSRATSVPDSLMSRLPEPLATLLLESGDADAAG